MANVSTISPSRNSSATLGMRQKKVDFSSFDSRTSRRMQGLLRKIKKSTFPRQLKLPADSDEALSPLNSSTVSEGNQNETLQEKIKRLEKDVKSALHYYKVILEKGFVEKLPGTATVVLECVIAIEDIALPCFKADNDFPEKVLNSCRESLHRSVTSLIRLSDDVLFDSCATTLVEKAEAFKAVDTVLQALNELIDLVFPRLQRLSVNDEILRCHSPSSGSSSFDDTLDQDYPSGKSGNGDAKTRNLRGNKVKMRDSGIASVFSDAPHEVSASEGNGHSSPKPAAPSKPPLPSSENRSYYGNQPFHGQNIKKALSNPGIMGPSSPLALNRARPNSTDVRSSPSTSYLSSDAPLSPTSSAGSRSSFGSNLSPSGSARSSLNQELAALSTEGNSTDADREDVDISDETYNQIQLYSKRYQVLATSRMSLFSEDCEGLFGGGKSLPSSPLSPTSPDYDEGAPSVPKKTSKFTQEKMKAYCKIVGGYNTEVNADRPTSFYDNYPLVADGPGLKTYFKFPGLKDGEDGPPALPPKKYHSKPLNRSRSYSEKKCDASKDKHNRRAFTLARRKVNRRSERDSTASYEEDNIPALDCLDVSRMLVFKDDGEGPVLCGGTVDSLIVYASECRESNDVYYKAFVSTYRTFVSPQQLICKLLYRANRFRGKGSLHISHGALLLLVAIVEELYEELDKSLFDQLRAEVHRLLNLGELRHAKSLRDKIVNYCLKLQAKLLPVMATAAQPKLSSGQQIFDFKSLDVAQQMTVLDADYFAKIALPEILAWGKEQSELLSPNLAEFIEHFNSMSFWCRTLILNEPRQQERERLYRKLLKIMRHCLKLNNFSSYLAILSALDSSPIRRLEWPRQLTDILEEHSQLIDSASAFKNYRLALADAKPPCIPYLGLILQDITFIHLGNPSELKDGKVNFVKCWQQFDVLETVQRFKNTLYDFSRNDKIVDFFGNYEEYMNEDDLWDKSQTLRPRPKK